MNTPNSSLSRPRMGKKSGSKRSLNEASKNALLSQRASSDWEHHNPTAHRNNTAKPCDDSHPRKKAPPLASYKNDQDCLYDDRFKAEEDQSYHLEDDLAILSSPNGYKKNDNQEASFCYDKSNGTLPTAADSMSSYGSALLSRYDYCEEDQHQLYDDDGYEITEAMMAHNRWRAASNSATTCTRQYSEEPYPSAHHDEQVRTTTTTWQDPDHDEGRHHRYQDDGNNRELYHPRRRDEADCYSRHYSHQQEEQEEAMYRNGYHHEYDRSPQFRHRANDEYARRQEHHEVGEECHHPRRMMDDRNGDARQYRTGTEHYCRGHCQEQQEEHWNIGRYHSQEREQGRHETPQNMPSSHDHSRAGMTWVSHAHHRATSSTATSSGRTRPSENDQVSVEIAPGLHVPLRRSDETYRAIANDFYAPVTCMACHLELCCIANAAFVLCPECKVVSPMIKTESNEAEEKADEPPFGLGLGFTYEHLFQVQAEILLARRRST